MRKIILGLFLGCLSACQQYVWVKDGASTTDLAKAQYSCEKEAARLYPVYMVPDHETVVKRSPNCGHNGNYRPDKNNPPVPPVGCMGREEFTKDIVMIDANKQNRQNFMSKCMNADGWLYVPVKK